MVLAAGPWSGALARQVGLTVELRPVLEQICYFGGRADGSDHSWATRPCFYDWGDDIDPLRKYCMPTPVLGYKIGIDRQLRDFVDGDTDRTPSELRTRETEAVVARDFPGLEPLATPVTPSNFHR